MNQTLRNNLRKMKNTSILVAVLSWIIVIALLIFVFITPEPKREKKPDGYRKVGEPAHSQKIIWREHETMDNTSQGWE